MSVIVSSHAWCDNCKEIQPVVFDGLVHANTSGEYVGGDICCTKCAFIIATLYELKSEAVPETKPEHISA